MTIKFSEYQDIPNLSDDLFTEVKKFSVLCQNTESLQLGAHAYFVDGQNPEALLSFPWWDNADIDMRGWTRENLPLGSMDQPHDDLEQGWQILIWEKADRVYFVEGNEECRFEFEKGYWVPRHRYFEAWEEAIRNVRRDFRNFDRLESAREYKAEVQGLFLRNHGLSQVPVEVLEFKTLTKLDLSLNQLKEIPEEFKNLNQLKFISLGMNKIKKIPEAFRALQNLEELILFDNLLTDIPQWLLDLPKLRRLHLSENKIPKALREKILQKFSGAF